jgi:hypothetical protein
MPRPFGEAKYPAGLPQTEMAYQAEFDRVIGTNTRGPRDDFYALGMLMFHCLTGAPPVMGRSGTDVTAKLKRMVWPRIDTVVKQTAQDPPLAALGDMVAKLSALEAAQAFGSYDEILAALQEARASIPAKQEDPRAFDPVQACMQEEAKTAQDSPQGLRAALDRAMAVGRSVWRPMTSGISPLDRAFAIGLIVAALLGFVVLGGIIRAHSREFPTTPDAEPLVLPDATTTVGTAPDNADAAADAGRKAFMAAEAFYAQFPAELAGATQKFAGVASAFPNTRWAEEAKRRIGQIEQAKADRVLQELARLRKEVEIMARWKRYAEALKRCDQIEETFKGDQSVKTAVTEMRGVVNTMAQEDADGVLSKARSFAKDGKFDEARQLLRGLRTSIGTDRFKSLIDVELQKISEMETRTKRAVPPGALKDAEAAIKNLVVRVSELCAKLDYASARADCETTRGRLKGMADFDAQRQATLDAVEAAVKSEGAFFEKAIQDMNAGKNLLHARTFLEREMDASIIGATKDNLTLQFTGQTGKVVIQWTTLKPGELYALLGSFRDAKNPDENFAMGAFCLHRGMANEMKLHFKAARAAKPELERMITALGEPAK